jgi:hypothetical protein
MISGDCGVDFGGPGVNAAAEGLSLFEALVAEPDHNVHGANSVMSESDDVAVRVEFPEGAGGDVAHIYVGAVLQKRQTVNFLQLETSEKGCQANLARSTTRDSTGIEKKPLSQDSQNLAENFP